MTDREPRVLLAWTAVHDNGWVATVLETTRGTFSAWLSREGEALSVDNVEHEPEAAKSAAVDALRSRTAHAECSERCTEWRLHTHEFTSNPAGPEGGTRP